MTKEDYKKLWKTLANDKSIKAYHVVQRCIIKAMTAKGENKEEILTALLKKAFSAKNDGSYPGLEEAANTASRSYIRQLFNGPPLKDYLSEEELTEYTRLLKTISSQKLVETNMYSYIFVRQDLKPEYQLVQAAHATCVLGSKLNGKVDPSNLYFVVSGVKDLDSLQTLMDSLSKKGHEYVSFVEPDIGNEITAIATLPIRGDMRKDFKKFKLLTF